MSSVLFQGSTPAVDELIAERRRTGDDAGHYLRTAAVAVAVMSPNERLDKRRFYRAQSVDEVVIVDPAKGAVSWYAIDPDVADRYKPVSESAVLPVTVADIVALLDF